NILIDLTETENISVIERIIVLNQQNSTINSISLLFNETLTNLKIEEENQALFSYNITSNPYSISIDFLSPIETNETRELKLQYNLEKSTQLLDQNYQRFYFGYYNTLLTTQKYIIVRLSKNSEIHPDAGSILPPTERPELTYEGFVDIRWSFINLSASTYDFIQVIFKPQTSTPIWIFILGPFLGLACGVTGTIWIMRRRNKKTIKEIGRIFLSDTEKEILKLIEENEGKISQKNLCAKTGYTKAKVSRNLISLEKQNLVTREKWGRNFRVYITDMGKKVIE
ncbi:MAG: helix-turn-helix transcriptional regulator, partial [Candidatus Heimdallarchaeaceae archaeon]